MIKEGYSLVWNDEFEKDGPPDPEKWSFDVGNHQWYNGELQAYTNRKDNVYVKDGHLYIIARKQKDGEREYTSARVTTSGKKSWKYGYFEIKAKLPKGKGSWPAIWMLPDSQKQGRRWPECGEIDIMEHAGCNEDRIVFSLHSAKHNHTRNDTVQYSTTREVEGVCSSFHTYGMEWTPDFIKYYVDDILLCQYNKTDDKEDMTEAAWPYDQPFYLILNIAVGGSMGGEVDEKSLPYVMEVDYVRVYQKSILS